MKLCLCMIVRDEEELLGSCLESALELGVDSYVIADTGSVDGTVELAREKLEGIDGELFALEWKGYAHARSEVFRRARGKAELLLVLDADMKVSGRLPRAPFADAYRATVAGRKPYTMTLLFRGDLPWKYVGVAHSVPDRADGETWSVETSELVIDDRRPGGWRPGKLEEDARLLELAIAHDPTDARSSFYLAQTYENLGRRDDAIREYGRRGLLLGWAEERFVAKHRRARLLQDAEPRTALAAFLEAWSDRPTRAEPLYCAARLCRLAGWYELALLFARRAVEISRPDDRLFVEEAVYEWGCELELGVGELRAGSTSVGAAILEALRDRVPEGFARWIDELLEELPEKEEEGATSRTR